jgi:branched-chain amino acid transport system substrate-binding protein
VAALTWDATNILLKAIQDMGSLGDDLKENRKNLRDALANVAEFQGITGTMKFDAQGDPIKCAVVVRINENGEFEFTKSVCP